MDRWMGVVGAWLVLGNAAVGAESAAPGSVRVLLLETPGPVEVAGQRVAARAGGLSVAGRPADSVWRPAGRGPHQVEDLRVQGSVEVRRTAAGLRVLNRVPLEDYVASALGSEIYHSWESAALEAQAVVTRTFALHRSAARRGEAFDVSAGTSDQVYRGLDAVSAPVRSAVRATRGLVLVHGGAPILAAFHSASGGRSASAAEVWGRELPYLVSRPVADEEDSPDAYWRVRIPRTTLSRAVVPLGLRLGAIREVRVAERTPSGRARLVWLRGTRGEGSLPARALRSVLGDSVVRSTLFEVRRAGDDFIFVGSGHGHGVGMSQWGAQAMAKRGATYREILASFYPGTSLVRRFDP